MFCIFTFLSIDNEISIDSAELVYSVSSRFGTTGVDPKGNVVLRFIELSTHAKLVAHAPNRPY
jgi:hypothetical protein